MMNYSEKNLKRHSNIAFLGCLTKTYLHGSKNNKVKKLQYLRIERYGSFLLMI
jgi:hypothetical protein